MRVYKVQQHEFFVSEHCTINILLLQCELCCIVAKLVHKTQECTDRKNSNFWIENVHKLFVLAVTALFQYLLLRVLFMQFNRTGISEVLIYFPCDFLQ